MSQEKHTHDDNCPACADAMRQTKQAALKAITETPDEKLHFLVQMIGADEGPHPDGGDARRIGVNTTLGGDPHGIISVLVNALSHVFADNPEYRLPTLLQLVEEFMKGRAETNSRISPEIKELIAKMQSKVNLTGEEDDPDRKTH